MAQEYKIWDWGLQANGLAILIKMVMESSSPKIVEPIGILGYGIEGKSTAKYLVEEGFKDITVFDQKRPAEKDLLCGENNRLKYAEGYLSDLPKMKTVFRSAGVRADFPEMEIFLKDGGILTSQTGLAFYLAGRDRIIGITGTLGKGTCCSLLKAILDFAKIPSQLGGNIGIPALDLIRSFSKDEFRSPFLILELSSFQLSTLSTSPAYAGILRTTSEHLDWHLSRDEYWLHKSNLVKHQGEKDFLTYCTDAVGSEWIAQQGKARKWAYGMAGSSGTRGPATHHTNNLSNNFSNNSQPKVLIENNSVHWPDYNLKIPLSATKLTGAFNLENLAAAGSLALQLGAKPADIEQAAANFSGLEHRLEFIRQMDGISFYNDSYATRPDATLGAIDALSAAPLALILGGSDKQADFSELAEKIAQSPHIVAIALIGQTADRLAEELNRAKSYPHSTPIFHPSPALQKCATLEEAINFLLSKLKHGSLVLSPACASFGMFENYKERGKIFKGLVRAL